MASRNGKQVPMTGTTTMKGRFLAQDIHFQCPEHWTIEDADREVAAIEAEARASVIPAAPEPPPLDVEEGIVQQSHIACCWCGEHHEGGD